MPRSRYIRPSFFSNEQLADLAPLDRLFFQGLWCWADREGRLEDRPRRLKANILPFDDWPGEQALQRLAEAGFLLRYEVEGRRYLQILNWNKHAKPHHEEETSIIPPPKELGLLEDSSEDSLGTPQGSNSGLPEDSPTTPAGRPLTLTLTSTRTLTRGDTRASAREDPPPQGVQEKPGGALAYFELRYVEIVRRMVVLTAEDTERARLLLRTHGLEATCRAIDRYFAEGDDFVRRKGFPFWLFFKHATEWFAGTPARGSPADEEALRRRIEEEVAKEGKRGD